MSAAAIGFGLVWLDPAMACAPLRELAARAGLTPQGTVDVRDSAAAAVGAALWAAALRVPSLEQAHLTVPAARVAAAAVLARSVGQCIPVEGPPEPRCFPLTDEAAVSVDRAWDWLVGTFDDDDLEQVVAAVSLDLTGHGVDALDAVAWALQSHLDDVETTEPVLHAT